MSITPVSSITRAATRKLNEPLNILTAPTHERYETGLAKTGHNFYAYQHESFKGWATKYAKIPDNYVIFDKSLNVHQIPKHMDFDLVLSQNKFGQFQILAQIASQLHLPLISLEHTLPVPYWPEVTLHNCRNMRGIANIFISDYSIDKWGWDRQNDTYVIRHCVDTELFRPDNTERKNQILTVANDYIGRDWCLNFQQYINVTKDMPVCRVGDTQGFSEPAKDIKELVNFYQTSSIFLNTAHISPIPTSLLEAMACECACVSIRASEIPHYIEHGVNGLLADNDEEMKQHLNMLLSDEILRIELGKQARLTILEKCNELRFINEWNNIFSLASKSIFRG